MDIEKKKILIGVSGGIAAYKAAELVRLFVRAGAEVRCVMTRAASEFITPLTLQTLSGNAVYTDLFRHDGAVSTEHVSVAQWADLFVVAPATANVIGKFANGIADDPLSTTFLAFSGQTILAPAMNCEMYAHPAVRRNLQALADMAHTLAVGPDHGFLACGVEGRGRMADPVAIFDYVASLPENALRLKVYDTTTWW